MTIRYLTQADVAKAEADVLTDGKTRELRAYKESKRGQLILFLRRTMNGVSGHWSIKQTGTRKLEPVGPYSKAGGGGTFSIADAVEQYKLLAQGLKNHAAQAHPEGDINRPRVLADRLRPARANDTVRALVDAYLRDYAKPQLVDSTYITLKGCLLKWMGPIANIRACNLTGDDIRIVMAQIKKAIAEKNKLHTGESQADRFRCELTNIYRKAVDAKADIDDADIPASLAAFAITKATVDSLETVKAIKGVRKARDYPGMNPDFLPMIYANLDGRDSRGQRSRSPRAIHVSAMCRLVMLYGGTRFAQIARLTTANIDWDDKLLRLDDIKGGRLSAHKYTFPLTPEAINILKSLEPILTDEPQFKGENLRHTMAFAMTRAGIKSKQPRDIRATVTQWFDQDDVGVDSTTSNFIQSHGMGDVVTKHYKKPSYTRKSNFGLRVDAAFLKLEDHLLGRAQLKQAA